MHLKWTCKIFEHMQLQDLYEMATAVCFTVKIFFGNHKTALFSVYFTVS